MCVKGKAIIDALSLTKREGILSRPVDLFEPCLFKYLTTLFADINEKEKLLNIILF
jgi:hypothetical protein